MTQTFGQAQGRIEAALENIKKLIWSAGKPDDVKPIFVLTVKIGRTGTGRHVRYLLPTGDKGPGALLDITGRVARAIGKNWNDVTGTYHVKGGDGTDAINLLSIELFGDHDKIPVYSI